MAHILRNSNKVLYKTETFYGSIIFQKKKLAKYDFKRSIT
jgi:hypothetical protein